MPGETELLESRCPLLKSRRGTSPSRRPLSSGPLFRDEEKVESGHSVLCGIMEGAVSPSGRRESLQENKVPEVRPPPSFPPLPIAEDHLF